MICPECDFENLPDSTFCTQCGHKFTDTKRSRTRSPYQVRPNFSLQLTLACSLLFPGAGHLYLRQYAQGFILLLSAFVSLVLAVYYFGTINHAAAFAVFSAVVVYSIADAYRLAMEKNDLPFKTGWIYTVVGVGYALLIICSLLWASRYYSFVLVRRAVTAAAELKINDQILVQRSYYVDHTPIVGDMVAGPPFGYGKITHVENDKFYVKSFTLRVDQENGRFSARTHKILPARYPEIGKLIYIITPIDRRRAL